MAKTIVTVDQGGTGAETASAARTALGAAADAFTQTGTGAVATTVDAKLKEMMVSVTDFGATGLGVADDTAAIQAAWDSIKSHNGTLFIPNGTYRCDSALDFRVDYSSSTHHHEVVGDGAVLDFSNTSLTTGALITFGSTVGSSEEKSHYGMSGIHVHGPESGTIDIDNTSNPPTTSLVGIRFTYAIHLVLDNIRVFKCYTGIDTDKDVYPITARNIRVDNCFVGLHLTGDNTIGFWQGCNFTEGRFGVVLKPVAGKSIYTQTFIDTNVEGNFVGWVFDPLDTGDVLIHGIRIIDPYIESIKLDAFRIGRHWTETDAGTAGADVSGKITNITIQGGTWSGSRAAFGIYPYAATWDNDEDHSAILLPAADSADAPAGLVIDIPVLDALSGFTRKSQITTRIDNYQGMGTDVNQTLQFPAEMQSLNIKSLTNTNISFLTFEDSDENVLGDVSTDSSGNGRLHLEDTSSAIKIKLNTAGDSYFTGGSFGIGTAAPTRLLHLSSTGGTFVRFTSEHANDFSVGVNSAGWNVYNESSGYALVIDGASRVTVKKSSNGEVTALSDGANIATDLALSNNFSVTLAGNRVLDNPSNLVAGQSGVIVITQDGTGSRTLDVSASYWHFEGGTEPTLSTAASAVDTLVYYVASASSIQAVLLKDLK